MRRIWAVAVNTIATALRMKTAVLCILLLVLLLPAVNLTSTGDGTAKGRLQSFVSYSLSMTTFILSLMTIVVSIHSISGDLKQKRILMVIVKPIRRFEFLLGKLLGVVALDVVLLGVFVSAIYFQAVSIPYFSKITEQDKRQLDEEFFTARKRLAPGIDEQTVGQQARQRLDEMKKTGKKPEEMSDRQVYEQLVAQLRGEQMAVQPGRDKIWEFTGLSKKIKGEYLFVRFKYNAAGGSSKQQIDGIWYVGDDRQVAQGVATLKTPIYQIPRRDAADTVQEFAVPGNAVADDGYVAIGFMNPPSNNTTLMFDLQEGFNLLFKAGSFSGNFARASAVMLAGLVFLAALGIALSTFLSMPVAALICFAVFFMGTINGFIIDSFDAMGDKVSMVYNFGVKPILWLLPRFDGDWNPCGYIISAELLGPAFMMHVAGSLAVKAFALFLAAVAVFNRRELAKVSI